MLQDFINEHRAELIARCRARVAARMAPRPTPAEIEHGVPLFLDQLAAILRLDRSSSPELRNSAARHGEELLDLGLTVGQVVLNYGDICQAITDLAIERKAPISIAEFRTLNRCLDDAIANAVTEYGNQHDRRISAERNEHLGIFAHELRNLLNSASLAFEVLRTGRVGVGGASGAILARSLSALRALVNHSLTDSRLNAGIQNRERIAMAEFLGALEASAAMEARERGLSLTVSCVEGDVAVEADRHILTSAVANLLQNAFKFTRPAGRVSLRLSADADRVRLEVEDECGGLPPGDPRALFLPYQQRGRDRTGLGLGLAISHRGVEATGGVLLVRDIPGTGCVFTVDLPRAALPTKPTLRKGSREGQCPTQTCGAAQ